jgi:ABC-2 type transport system ATP-binding protein
MAALRRPERRLADRSVGDRSYPVVALRSRLAEIHERRDPEVLKPGDPRLWHSSHHQESAMKNLEIRDLVKSFGETRAVDHVSFSVRGGIIFGLVGRNGAGKTTTIRMITDIYTPDSGQILFHGEKRDAGFHCRIGYLPEERGLYKFMSVLDNLAFLAEIKGIKPAQSRPKAKEYLERFDLAKKGNSTVDSLSKGNQQKVQFIGTILHDPEMVIFDEPFSGLDPVNANLFKDVIVELRNAGKIVILSTHAMEIAEKICDEICLIDKGKVILNASMTDIKRQYSQSVVNLLARGDLSFLSTLPFVTTVRNFGNETSVQVRTDADIQELLRVLLSRNLVVRKFQADEMSLHDIFVSLTSTKEEVQASESFAAKTANLETVA